MSPILPRQIHRGKQFVLNLVDIDCTASSRYYTACTPSTMDAVAVRFYEQQYQRVNFAGYYIFSRVFFVHFNNVLYIITLVVGSDDFNECHLILYYLYLGIIYD